MPEFKNQRVLGLYDPYIHRALANGPSYALGTEFGELQNQNTNTDIMDSCRINFEVTPLKPFSSLAFPFSK